MKDLERKDILGKSVCSPGGALHTGRRWSLRQPSETMCSGDFKFPPFHISNFCNQRPNEIPNWFNFHRRTNPPDLFRELEWARWVDQPPTELFLSAHTSEFAKQFSFISTDQQPVQL